MQDSDRAQTAYEHASRDNPQSIEALMQLAGIARVGKDYGKAVEYFKRVLTLEVGHGEAWSGIAHCYLMQDDLQKAFHAYQQGLYWLPNPKENPELWYGIGILYHRSGRLDHAEEAFVSALRMDKGADGFAWLSEGATALVQRVSLVFMTEFDKADDILYRLGKIYKEKGEYSASIDCFKQILHRPPNPFVPTDIWFQIGQLYELQEDYVHAKEAYERIVAEEVHHAKALRWLGWLYHQPDTPFQDQKIGIQYLTKSLEVDPGDSESWYLIGRAYVLGQNYTKAMEAYKQTSHRDGRSVALWCSIGVLYLQVKQYGDALDAYSRAIRINPQISEVWFHIGSLYEIGNNQIGDAINAYAYGCKLDPDNEFFSHRLQLLKRAQATGSRIPAHPGPEDMHPIAYAELHAVAPPTGQVSPPLPLPFRRGVLADYVPVGGTLDSPLASMDVVERGPSSASASASGLGPHDEPSDAEERDV